jgi:hypothetical protein
MGILDSKTRIMDVVMTPLGRAALARGGLNIAYASFTDGQAYYDPSSITGSYDTATDRIYLEAPPSLPQDTLAIVTDDSGNIIPQTVFSEDSYVVVGPDGSVYDPALSSPLNNISPTLSGAFSSAVTLLGNSFLASYNYNTFIGTKPPLDDVVDFTITPTTASFRIPNDLSSLGIIEDITSVDSLFFDRRFANFSQFKFLPPVVSNGQTDVNLGSYTNIRQTDSYTYEDMKNEIFGTDANPVKQRFSADFEETSHSNDIVAQMFEITTDGVKKLDAFDFGEINDPSDISRPNKRIVFFGKVFTDDAETSTYVNLFTVVLD